VPDVDISDLVIPREVVRSKSNFIRRYARGEFGNMVPTWSTLKEYEESKYPGPVHLRNRVAGGATWYNVPPDMVDVTYRTALNSGLNHQDIYISAMAPEHLKTFQGEVVRSPNGPRLYYNTQALPMREGFAIEQKWVNGATAMRLLEHYMDASSFNWLQQLFDLYPGHVVEFSCYSRAVGTLELNTIWWEVRSY
jgi:hypothetical protein